MDQQYTIPTRSEALRRRQQEQQGFLYPLPRTGGHAHVRRLSLAELASLSGLPPAMQQTVLRVFRDVGADNGSGPLTWDRLTRNQTRQRELADAICCAGFVRPRLVMTEAELDGSEDCWLVTDLHIDERVGYLNLCVAGGGDERLIPFPVSGMGGVAVVPSGQTAEPPIHVVGHADGRLHPGDMPGV